MFPIFLLLKWKDRLNFFFLDSGSIVVFACCKTLEFFRYTKLNLVSSSMSILITCRMGIVSLSEPLGFEIWMYRSYLSRLNLSVFLPKRIYKVLPLIRIYNLFLFDPRIRNLLGNNFIVENFFIHYLTFYDRNLFF